MAYHASHMVIKSFDNLTIEIIDLAEIELTNHTIIMTRNDTSDNFFFFSNH
jgi:hypothetical protein